MIPGLTIIGGGPCGLYAAHTGLLMGAKVTLLEKESAMGGLAAGRRAGANWCDLGVHMLHAFDPEVFRTCAGVMGGERIEVPLVSHIKWGGKLYRYPLRGRDLLSGIPPFELARCAAGLAGAEIRSRFSPARDHPDAESALIALYGAPLYRFFFEEFTHRYWGIHPRMLSGEFVRRKMPRLSAVDLIKNLAQTLRIARPRDAAECALRSETLHYSPTGAETLPRTLACDIARRGAIVLADSPVTLVRHDGRSVTSIESRGRSIPTSDSRIVSTIPLPELIRMLDPMPVPEILSAAEELEYRALAVYALLVKKNRCMDGLYTYYRNRVFHRVGEPKNAGLVVHPAGHTLLVVETTASIGDRNWTGEAFPDIARDIATEGLCQEDQIASWHVFGVPYAYPVFKLGFENALARVAGWLECLRNFRTTGRQGGFTYPNIHEAMRMGGQAARDLLLAAPQ